MKKGFTIVELLGVIVILAVLLLVAVPVYNTVRENINESVYESKVKEVLSKSERYAEETGKMVFDVRNLIEEGSLTADNELEEFKDPRNGRNMACDIVNIEYKDSSFHASIKESETCYSIDELESMYGMVHLKLVDEEGKEINTLEGTNWLKENKIYVTYELQNEEAQVISLAWSGEHELRCEKEDIHSCRLYEVTASSIKSLLVTLRASLQIEGITLDTQVAKEVNLDIQRPQILQVTYNNDFFTSQNRKVDFEITDGSGSGIKEYALVTEKTCNGSEYDSRKKNATDGIQTEYLENGEYYICIEDKVGNRTNDADLENDSYKISIEKIDTTTSSVVWSIASSSLGVNDWYKELTLRASMVESESGILAANYCITTNGICTPSAADTYATISNNQFTVSLGTNKNPQKVCTQVTDRVGNQSEIICSPFYKVDLTVPNITSFTASNSWAKENVLTVKAQDSESGIVGYAFSKNSNTPNSFTNVTRTNAVSTYTYTATSNGVYYVFIKDSAGNVSKKSVTVNQVDASKPNANIKVTASGTNVTVDASGSSDSESGIKYYYYQANNGSWVKSTSPSYVFTGLSGGSQKICLYVEDNAGNTSSPICSTIEVDGWIETSFQISETKSGFHGGTFKILFGISAKNKTNFKGYIHNSTLYGLYTDCQDWKRDAGGACCPTGRWWCDKNTNTMHTFPNSDKGTISLKNAYVSIPSPKGPQKCEGTVDQDSGWVEKIVYYPAFYHEYMTNTDNIDSPKKLYQSVQFADSITVRARVVSQDCYCNNNRPDSDTPLYCTATVSIKAKVNNYKLQLLDQARLDQYPDATGYLTEDTLYTMKPTNFAVFLGSSWQGTDNDKNAYILGNKIIDISRYFS